MGNGTGLLLHAQNRVLGGFGHAEFHDALGRDLDGRASSGVAADAGLAVNQHQFAQSGQGEGVFGVLVRQFRNLFENFHGHLFGDAVLFGDFSCDL